MCHNVLVHAWSDWHSYQRDVGVCGVGWGDDNRPQVCHQLIYGGRSANFCRKSGGDYLTVTPHPALAEVIFFKNTNKKKKIDLREKS